MAGYLKTFACGGSNCSDITNMQYVYMNWDDISASLSTSFANILHLNPGRLF